MWYFDKLQRAYPKMDQKLVGELLRLTDTDFLNNATLPKRDNLQPNPLYEIGKHLRDKCLSEFENKFLNNPVKVFIHLPPASISPAGNSLFFNMGESFKHLGLSVCYFWDSLSELKFEKSKTNLILTSFDEIYRTKIDWKWISELQKQIKLHVGSTCPINQNSLQEISRDLELWLDSDSRFFYSFFNEKFVGDTAIGKYALSRNKKIYSMEFGANPLYHFPNKYINHLADYIFLGSANYDKIERYYQYFLNVFKQFKGIVAGPGWDWISNYEIRPDRDRFMYSKAKVGINLHIDMQIAYPSELNERTYILAACGIPQVVDKPLLIDSHFDKGIHIADGPVEYFDSIKNVLENYDEALQEAEHAMRQVFEKHTTFLRAENFFRNISNQF